MKCGKSRKWNLTSKWTNSNNSCKITSHMHIFIETRCATMDGRSAFRVRNAVTCGETYKSQARFKLEIPACARRNGLHALNRPPVSVLFLIVRLQSFHFFRCDIRCGRIFPIDERCFQQDSYTEKTRLFRIHSSLFVYSFFSFKLPFQFVPNFF